jgi:addiction module HigA family antidote
MAAESRHWQPDWAVRPGELLLEAIEDRGITQSDLARRMGRPIKTINEIVNGKASITPDTAIQLELTLGITAEFWNGLEATYRAYLARQRADEEFGKYEQWLAAFPLKDMVGHGLLHKGQTQAAAVAGLLRFFGVSTPEAWDNHWLEPAASFRASRAYKSSPHAAAAWLRWGELLAADVKAQRYDARVFRSVLNDIRRLTRRDLPLVQERIETTFADAGVILVFTPELSGARLSGAARWLSADRPLIQLSLRHKTNDQLWFSLYHEAGHLLTARRKDFIDDADAHDAADEDERAADEFARDVLVPPKVYAAFIAAGDFSRERVRALADQLEIAPGVVVGRLQRDEHLPKSQLNDLKKPLRFGRR